MNQLKFDILDLNRDEEALAVAKLHCAAPGEWVPEHSYSDNCVARAIESLRNSVYETHVVLAHNQENDLVGLHWIELEVRPDQRFGNVVSLWVRPSYRRQGVATRLKELAESWLRSNGASEVRTQVYVENNKMVAFNEKLGYKVVRVGMSKSLT